MPRRRTLALILLVPVLIAGAAFGVTRLLAKDDGGYDYVQRVVLPHAGEAIDLPSVAGPLDASRPLIVIDAGHGGHDPGASGHDLIEKRLTLDMAKALRDELLRGGGIRVALTREDDRFLVLEERSGIARRLGADLFVSIHADSVEASDVAHGASVYTLSERGSSETAARLAARENRADEVNGVSRAGTSDAVAAILVDLSQRDAQAKSDAFAALALRELRGAVALHDSQAQSAAFVVLKSPDMASALLESGYVSSADDAARLATAEGRKPFVDAIARAARIYFARQSAQPR